MTRDQEYHLLKIEKQIAEKRAAKAKATSEPLETLAALKYPHFDRADQLKAMKLELEIEASKLRNPAKAMSDRPDTPFETGDDRGQFDEIIQILTNVINDPTKSEKEKARAKRVLDALGEDSEKIEARARGKAVAMNHGTAQKFYVPRSHADALMDDFRRKYYGGSR